MRVGHYISDRYGGVSLAPYSSLNIAYHTGDDPKAVERNRQILFQKANITQAQFAHQIHGTQIRYIDKISSAPHCDGLITDRANLPLAIMSADCFGVLLYDEAAGVIAALHAGRSGASEGIVKKGIAKLNEFGAKNPHAIIGPGIHVCCYEISPQLAAQYPKRFIKKDRFLDIKKIIYEDLKEGGVESIYDYNICTACDKRYYSYRREGVTGRFATIIWMEER
ncbi:MAG: peptidoglycan editing factor PgeF [Epsilonproteobacteria bacterium]|nr:peptidoglycan editing factor PgeF [Campylobacterota bacterium]NPA63543.1 peptidoglycan editing factor PgeF [Campylobacterota bacterium]